jgi:Spy/CpxP family protein refolding chaperone
MNRIALAALVSAAVTLGAASVEAQKTERPNRPQAGERRGGPARAGRQALFRGIELTDAQRTKMQEIHKSFAPQRQEVRKSFEALRAKGERPDSAAMLRLKDLAKREQTEIRAVLTAEQQTTFDANAKAMAERRGRHAKRG